MTNLNGNGKRREMEPEMLTAYALGQLEGEELEQGARAASAESVQQEIGGIRKVAEMVAELRNAEALPESSATLRERIETRLLETAAKVVPPKFVEVGERRRMWWRRAVAVVCLGGGVAGLLFAISFVMVASKVEKLAWSTAVSEATSMDEVAASTQAPAKDSESQLRYQGGVDEALDAPAVPDARAQTRTPRIIVKEDEAADAPAEREWRWSSGNMKRPTAAVESAEARPTVPQERLPTVPKMFGDASLPRDQVTIRPGAVGGPAPPARDPFAAPPGDIPGSQPYVPPTNFPIAPGSGPVPRPGMVAGRNASADGGYGAAVSGDVSGGGYFPTPGGVAPGQRAARAAVPSAQVPGVYPESQQHGFQPAPTVGVPLSAAPAKDGLARATSNGASGESIRFKRNAAPGLSGPGDVKGGQQGQGQAALPEARVEFEVGNEWEAQRLAVRGRTDSLDLLRDRADGELEKVDSGQNLGVKTWYYRRKGTPGTEQYEAIVENAFLDPRRQPLSTFSIDVDTASYANVRRFLNSGRLPPANAVRIEEMVNYFRYEGPGARGQEPEVGGQRSEVGGQRSEVRGQKEEPFTVGMEVAECPWAGGTLTPALSQGEREKRGHWLLKVTLKGREVRREKRPANNLVFLLDVSGSMADANKLPLLKTAMQMFVRELGESDRVSIVTYAGEAGLKLSPTRGHEQEKIHSVIESLTSGGSTNGSAGIELAYEQAAAYFEEGGTNRVILCTDGDLNVGITSDDALVELIKKKAKGGTFLTVLGFGEGNLKDAKMEKLADNGNGLYAYIDSVREARKVLVEQLTGSTITIAKDVKIQIEFNPAEIASYRLLGYENRVMAAQDFNNDRKDAGEIGAGHSVTALYEVVPVGGADEAERPQDGVDKLRYQEPGTRSQEPEEESKVQSPRSKVGAALTEAAKSGELLTLKLRYKEPEGSESKLLEFPLKVKAGGGQSPPYKFSAASKDMQFAAAVAAFGMILRGSEHKGNANLAAVAEIAEGAIGEDPGGYRTEFLDLVRRAQALGAR